MEHTGPERLAEVLSRLFLERGWGRQQQQQQLEGAWREAVGHEIAARTRSLLLKRGILEIQVADSVLLQELANFQKRRLIVAMQKLVTSSQIKDLRFRLG